MSRPVFAACLHIARGALAPPPRREEVEEESEPNREARMTSCPRGRPYLFAPHWRNAQLLLGANI
eukprot:7349065-Pyramimonas_sp.AAC.1